MRNLLLFLLLLAVVYYVRRALSRSADEAARPEEFAAAPNDAQREAEQVVPCAHCGVLAPPSEGVTRGVNFYCSPEHADLGPRT